MTEVQIVQKTTTKTKRSIDLSSIAIIGLLKSALEIPDTARVYFTVPGGGDWSNCEVDIDPSNPISIEWTEVVES